MADTDIDDLPMCAEQAALGHRWRAEQLGWAMCRDCHAILPVQALATPPLSMCLCAACQPCITMPSKGTRNV